jgi:hypothetical protein
MMWDWNHFKSEGWLSHTKRAFKLSLLLLGSAAALFIHMVVPFWMPPQSLRLLSVAEAIDREMSLRE